MPCLGSHGGPRVFGSRESPSGERERKKEEIKSCAERCRGERLQRTTDGERAALAAESFVGLNLRLLLGLATLPPLEFYIIS